MWRGGGGCRPCPTRLGLGIQPKACLRSAHIQYSAAVPVPTVPFTQAVFAPDTEDSLTCIVPRGRGFITAGRKGVLYFYDPPDVAAKK